MGVFSPRFLLDNFLAHSWSSRLGVRWVPAGALRTGLTLSQSCCGWLCLTEAVFPDEADRCSEVAVNKVASIGIKSKGLSFRELAIKGLHFCLF